jgi:hypothetical protein
VHAGGVVVSYFEWLQNKRSEFWDLEEVDAKLQKKIVHAHQHVRDKARELKTDWRTAAASLVPGHTSFEAFTDGLYLVIIDEVEYRELDAIVRVEPDSRITFLRLTFLAGA